jgi:murein DD-endopeptidase MepM/ murein hydrolase activator NlpD
METQTYSIASGDTISAVAQRHDMTVAQITMMNPGLNVDVISIGQEIQLSAAVPFLSLRQTRTESYEEPIAFETIIEYSDAMYTNQSKITQPGVPGLAAVVADVAYTDGRVTDRDVLEYTVLTAPTVQIKLVGTQKPPPKSPTGTFVKPSNGSFSSGYGYRRNLGDNHTGVDFAGRVGTAVWAADGGTVTYAGWKGNYGYCVIISHGNGVETLYAHNSELLVKAGQKVAKREQIAKVGNTGRSTGPHCHFEIRINGDPVNPLKYINK